MASRLSWLQMRHRHAKTLGEMHPLDILESFIQYALDNPDIPLATEQVTELLALPANYSLEETLWFKNMTWIAINRHLEFARTVVAAIPTGEFKPSAFGKTFRDYQGTLASCLAASIIHQETSHLYKRDEFSDERERLISINGQDQWKEAWEARTKQLVGALEGQEDGEKGRNLGEEQSHEHLNGPLEQWSVDRDDQKAAKSTKARFKGSGSMQSAIAKFNALPIASTAPSSTSHRASDEDEDEGLVGSAITTTSRNKAARATSLRNTSFAQAALETAPANSAFDQQSAQRMQFHHVPNGKASLVGGADEPPDAVPSTSNQPLEDVEIFTDQRGQQHHRGRNGLFVKRGGLAGVDGYASSASTASIAPTIPKRKHGSGIEERAAQEQMKKRRVGSVANMSDQEKEQMIINLKAQIEDVAQQIREKEQLVDENSEDEDAVGLSDEEDS